MMPSNDLPNNFKETEIGPIPVDWEVVRLGDVLQEVDVRAKNMQNVKADQLPILSLTKDHGLILQSKRFGKRIAKDDVSEYKVVKRGWIVYNPYVIWEGAIYALRDRDYGLVSPVYLIWEAVGAGAYFLDYLVRTPMLLNAYLRFCSGTVKRRRSLRKTAFLDIKIPLPPLTEQRRIAHVLNTIQRAVAAQDDLIAAAREVKRSLMQRLFTCGPGPEPAPTKETEIGEMPEHWEVVRLEEIAKIERGKFAHRPRNDPRFYGGTIPFIQTGDVANSGGRITSYSQTLNELGLSVSRVFPKGTIVITIAANIGYTGILGFDSAFPDSLIGITPASSMDNIFLEYYLQTQQPKMDALAPRGTQKNINIQFLKPWPVPKPQLTEQKEIADVLSVADRKIEAEEQRKAALQSLFKAMLHQLMTGQLRLPKSPRLRKSEQGEIP